MISVIVCTYNRSRSLATTLESLERTSLPREKWEVIVVDNNSDDDTQKVCEAFATKWPGHFRYFFEGRQGKPYALNTGIENARGEWLAFTDDDVTVEPQWLEEILSTFERYNCAGVAGKILPDWKIAPPPRIRFEGKYRVTPGTLGHYDLGEEIRPARPLPYGANMAFRRDVFTRFGGFSPAFRRGQDTEFCNRLERHGELILYNPRAVVYHAINGARARASFYQDWYFALGRTIARLEKSSQTTKSVFGIPRYLLRQAAEHGLRWATSLQAERRFYYKLQLFLVCGKLAEFVQTWWGGSGDIN